jgi:hypothetical protein
MDEKNKPVWHTAKWYKANFGVDVLKANIPFKEVKNPIYSTASPMKLWKEEDILPFKNEENIKKFQKRSEIGKRVFVTKKENMINWFESLKEQTPEIKEITKRLWVIGEKISELHGKKAECRENDENSDSSEYFESDIEHCNNCRNMSSQQNRLRNEREELFVKLQKICGKDIQFIQLVRRYCREKYESSQLIHA